MTHSGLNIMNIGFIVALSILISLGFFSYNEFENSDKSTNRVKHAYQVMQISREIMPNIRASEKSRNKFITTANENYLEEFYFSVKKNEAVIETIKKLVTDENQQKIIDIIDQLSSTKLAEITKAISLRRTQGLNVALSYVAFGGTKWITNELESQINKLDNSEQNLLRKTSLDYRESKATTKTSLIIGTLASLVLFVSIYFALHIQILRRKTSEEKTIQSKKWFSKTLKSIGDAVIATDENSVVTYLNPTAEELTGWNKEKAKGEVTTTILSIINKTTRKKVDNPTINSIIEKRIIDLEDNLVLVKKDNSEIHIEGSSSPILDEDGDVVGSVLVFRDVTRQKNAESNLLKLFIELENKNKEITDSIHCAKNIQNAFLPEKSDLIKYFPESFMLFKPKDILSGDFYWIKQIKERIILVLADCTGHGVPGALMSMIGSQKLSESIAQNKNPSEILKCLNQEIKKSLHQSEDNRSSRDGMDIAICSINTEDGTIEYAGANRPLWIAHKGESQINEIKGTKKAIGGFTEDDQHFDTHQLKLKEGDTIYLFSDGVTDTFNAKGKKVSTKRFKSLLADIQNETMAAQGKILNEFIETWKAGTEQVDDILVIGVKMDTLVTSKKSKNVGFNHYLNHEDLNLLLATVPI